MNRITPRDVGQRVSVRRVLAGGGAGERFTDVVGRLAAWDDGVLTITRRDGVDVHVPEAELVAGKTVPAPPPRGAAAVAAGRLQEVVADAWPGVTRERLGGWLLQAAGGFTRRANSVVPSGDPGMPQAQAVQAAQAWFAVRGLTPCVQIAETPENAGLDAYLAGLGWVEDGRAITRTAPLALVRDRAGGEHGGVTVTDVLDDAWLRRYGRTGDVGPDVGPDVRHVLAGPPGTLFATVPGPGDTPTAVGRLAVVGRYAYIAAVEVDGTRRREGFATTIMGALADAALARGATTALLQVEAGNEPARRLYDRLGFSDHHAYHYRIPGGGR